ncbi:MAG: hypothetical protein E4H09_04825, partial [Spirochaetales bacterium]
MGRGLTDHRTTLWTRGFLVNGTRHSLADLTRDAGACGFTQVWYGAGMVRPISVTPGVAVVGGINMDIHMKGRNATIVPGSSNPCTGWTAAGGVGRNVACALAGLGLPVALFGAVGDDLLSR